MFDGYLLVRAPGIPIPTTLGSADGRTVVSVTSAPRAACQHLPARFAGSVVPGYWCLHLAGLQVGTTVQGKIISPDAQLSLKVSARDPIVPLPLLVTFLGLLVGMLMLLFSPERLTPTLRRWSLYEKLYENSNAAQSGRPAITGISRDDLRSWTAANGRRLDRDASFIDAALEVLDVGRSQLMRARERLGETVKSASRNRYLKDSPLLNRAGAEASNKSAAWSDFFEDMGKRRTKMPPIQELDRLTFAIGLLDDLAHLASRIWPGSPEWIGERFDDLRAEIGQAGEAPDVDRALAAAEDGVRRLRHDIRPYVGFEKVGGAQADYREAPAGRRRPTLFTVFVSLAILSLVALIVVLLLTGHLKIIEIAGVVVAGIVAVIFLLLLILWCIIEAPPFLVRPAKWVYRQVWFPIARDVAARFRSWRYALLRNFVTATIIAILLIFGTISVLVTTYADREAFGKPLDYITLALAAATVSVTAAICGYFSNRFHDRLSKPK